MKIVLRIVLYLLIFSSTLVVAAPATYLRLATTTSTENSGLLAKLNVAFETQSNISVNVIAVGSGKAIRLAENGDVDLILVHAPKAEQAFVENGHGIERRPVMYNHFILLGPEDDPAKISTATDVQQAMRRLLQSEIRFISRGDDSGTHKKELELWQSIGAVLPGKMDYLSIGQGMGAALLIADDKSAYTLSDQGTYLAYQHKSILKTLFSNDDLLVNPYHVIIVNPQRHPHTKLELARIYSEFIRGELGQNIIKNFRINGQQLFYPMANDY